MVVRMSLCTGLALLASAAAAAPSLLPVHIGGRVIAEADGSASFGWPAVYFEGRFRGPDIRVKFEAPAEHMRLLIDGEEKLRFQRPGAVDLSLGGLADAEHVVRLEKLTESQAGGGRFFGFYASEDSAPLPPVRRARQIEFIGDSHSVGYGNMSSDRECTEAQVHDLTNSQVAFGPLVARHYDADYRVNAWSGRGIVRNYEGTSPEENFPGLYPRLKPDAPAQMETRDPDWRPQLIVVNLGTNDFSTPLHSGERWPDQAALKAAYRAGYVKFVRSLQKRQPQARFILMGSDAFFAEVEKVAAALNAGGRVTTLKFDGLDLGGCHFHPSLADHERLADLVRTEVDKLGDIWPEARVAYSAE
jgi:lysophospholipase L1-like esterase